MDNNVNGLKNKGEDIIKAFKDLSDEEKRTKFVSSVVKAYEKKILSTSDLLEAFESLSDEEKHDKFYYIEKLFKERHLSIEDLYKAYGLMSRNKRRSESGSLVKCLLSTEEKIKEFCGLFSDMSAKEQDEFLCDVAGGYDVESSKLLESFYKYLSGPVKDRIFYIVIVMFREKYSRWGMYKEEILALYKKLSDEAKYKEFMYLVLLLNGKDLLEAYECLPQKDKEKASSFLIEGRISNEELFATEFMNVFRAFSDEEKSNHFPLLETNLIDSESNSKKSMLQKLAIEAFEALPQKLRDENFFWIAKILEFTSLEFDEKILEIYESLSQEGKNKNFSSICLCRSNFETKLTLIKLYQLLPDEVKNECFNTIAYVGYSFIQESENRLMEAYESLNQEGKDKNFYLILYRFCCYDETKQEEEVEYREKIMKVIEENIIKAFGKLSDEAKVLLFCTLFQAKRSNSDSDCYDDDGNYEYLSEETIKKAIEEFGKLSLKTKDGAFEYMMYEVSEKDIIGALRCGQNMIKLFSVLSEKVRDEYFYYLLGLLKKGFLSRNDILEAYKFLSMEGQVDNFECLLKLRIIPKVLKCYRSPYEAECLKTILPGLKSEETIKSFWRWFTNGKEVLYFEYMLDMVAKSGLREEILIKFFNASSEKAMIVCFWRLVELRKEKTLSGKNLIKAFENLPENAKILYFAQLVELYRKEILLKKDLKVAFEALPCKERLKQFGLLKQIPGIFPYLVRCSLIENKLERDGDKNRNKNNVPRLAKSQGKTKRGFESID